jgi:ADP-ribose pyrophosphatase YjhB (NUDIX family)
MDGRAASDPTVSLEKLAAIAQAGLAYSIDPHDRERYSMLKVVAIQLMRELGAGQAAVDELYASDDGYRTPKVDVRGVVVRHDSVLLVCERTDGRWTLPGGWADVGESPAESVAREIEEETGYRARVVRLIALFDRNKHDHDPFPWHTYKAFFHCEVDGEQAHSTLETLGVGFFPVDALPELSTGRVTADQIRRLFDRIKRDDAEAMFD